MQLLDLHKHRRFTFVILSLLLCQLSGCSASGTPEGQKFFGVDSDYYIGLQLLSQNKEKEARTKFNNCIKKGSKLCARKSAEALTTFGDQQEKNQAALFLAENFPDSDSLLTAARQLSASSEIHKLIELTSACDSSTEYNETIKIRLEAMQKRGDTDFQTEVFNWFTSRPITETHYKFYRDILVHPDFTDEDAAYTPEDFILNYRIHLFRRDYTYCLENAQTVLDYLAGSDPTDTAAAPDNAAVASSNAAAPDNQTAALLQPHLLPQLASDLGKAFLYASQDYAKNGYMFRLLAEKYKDTELEYYFWFYAGRFYDKAQAYFTQTKKCFDQAAACATTAEQKDNAIWYALDSSLNFGTGSITETLVKYSRLWSDSSYFDDFFEKLISALLAGGKWNSFYEIYSQLDGYASDETEAQFAYIYGRLLQENYASPYGGKTKEQCIQEAFERSLKSGTSSYYKILAAFQLDYDATKIEKLLCKRNGSNAAEKNSTASLNDAEKLLKGYAYFGFPELIYDNYMNLYKDGISTDVSLDLAEFLQKCGSSNNEFYTQSLRIAARAINYGDRDFTKQEMKYLYPKDYLEYVDTYSKKYNCSQSVMFALIRSESFFNASVTSTAGAIGLCQLMEFTGADIAQRLRKTDYSLTDPETNIEFGCYYLNNLYTRCDNSYLQAFFAYNAGITRVRRWLQSSLIEFGKKSSMPQDIFLEAVPFSETREYGRKLISATVYYEWLYNQDLPSKTAFTNAVENLIN